mmetsp:Transcript_20401/g.53036  ORF Transcript_20401/g.53036 Transcript_20401/m.53036 type:complete len:286 (-) Transcript_20401:77-934(-)
MGCTGSKGHTNQHSKEYRRGIRNDVAQQNFPEAMNRMWSNPVTPHRLHRIAKDVARLAGRTHVACGGADVGATGGTDEQPTIFSVATAVARRFGDGEEAAVRTAAEGFATAGAAANPDMANVAANFIAACGGEASPTVRVLKCLHQKYILEAFCALRLGGPLEGLQTKDVAGPDGWRVDIGPRADGEGVLVRHSREERLAATMVPSPDGATASDAHVRWQLTMVFDAAVSRMTRCYCDVTAVLLPGGKLAPPKAVAKLHKRILRGGSIRVFDNVLKNSPDARASV